MSPRNLTPQQALLLSLCAALLTIGMKSAAWWITGSVGYLSDALESLVNLAGASFALSMLTYARRPPDRDHPFGHGKAEYFSAAFEGGMIFLAALAILVTAGQRLFDLKPVEGLGLGMLLSIAASIVNLVVARILMIVGVLHRSVALIADARHLMTDVWTTAGVIVGVGLAVLTGLDWLDPVVAILVALNILREGFGLLRRSVGGMMDEALDDTTIADLREVLDASLDEGCKVVNLRTRASGATRFAQVDLRVPGDWSVRKAHDLADKLEDAADAMAVMLTTHVEPIDRRDRAHGNRKREGQGRGKGQEQGQEQGQGQGQV